jgi:hypothetical protein
VPYEPLILSYDELRHHAEEFLAENYPETSIPIPIEEIVEFDFEMEIIPVPGLKDEIGVDAFLASDMSTVFVDEYVLRFVKVRYRFSLAHEIGHYWLHDDLYQAVTIGSVADWKRVQAEIGDEYQWFEFQANAFAGLVLVPPVALKARFIRRAEEAKAAGLDHASLLRHPLRHRMVEGLAGEFVVSEQTMAIRLEKDGLLAPLTRSRVTSAGN